MGKKIKMNFFVERDSANYSRAFLIARCAAALLPALYFIYIFFSYYSYSNAYEKVNDEIITMQEQISRYERELKNTKIIFIDNDTSEAAVSKGFFFDNPVEIFETVETIFETAVKERLVKFKAAMADSIKKPGTGERLIFESLAEAAGKSGEAAAINSARLDLSSGRLDFQFNCFKRGILNDLIIDLRKKNWVKQVFVETLKAAGEETSAYITITLKGDEIFE